MRSTALSQWLNRLRSKSVRKPRRTILEVSPLAERTMPAALAGSVYVDANNDGARDHSEAGISGVKIHLLGKTDCGQIVYKAAVTDNLGNYRFDDLAAGWYGLVERQPAGFIDGKDVAGSAGGHVVKRDIIVGIRLENCTGSRGYLFGEQPICSNGSDGKGSTGKGSHARCDSNKSHDKGSGGKGSHDRCDDGQLKGNNGVGNGLDPQPPGNPRINDGLGTSPGSPGNKN